MVQIEARPVLTASLFSSGTSAKTADNRSIPSLGGMPQFVQSNADFSSVVRHRRLAGVATWPCARGEFGLFGLSAPAQDFVALQRQRGAYRTKFGGFGLSPGLILLRGRKK